MFGKMGHGLCVISPDVSKTGPGQNWPRAFRVLSELSGGKCFVRVFPDREGKLPDYRRSGLTKALCWSIGLEVPGLAPGRRRQQAFHQIVQ